MQKRKIQRYNDGGLVTIYYGKPGHQEAEAAVSFADSFIMYNKEKDLKLILSYLQGDIESDEFIEEFGGEYSDGFTPEKLKDGIGLVAQTTMLKSGVEKHFAMFKEIPDLNARFQDSICGATEVRQRAIEELSQNPDINLYIIIGGYNSSNTGNLANIAKTSGRQVYHVDVPNKVSTDKITHATKIEKKGKELIVKEETVENWLPNQDVVNIGISSGASTPQDAVTEIISILSGKVQQNTEKCVDLEE